MVKIATKIIEYTWELGIAGFIVLTALAFLGLIILGGMVCYFLLSIVFPEYIVFGWHWWRFIALGILILIVS